MNKYSKLITAISASLLLVVMSFAIIISANAEPGDATNPLITKDYLDSVVSSLVAENGSLNAEVESLKSQIENINSNIFDSEQFKTEIENMINNALSGVDTGYKTVEIATGSTVMLGEGAEMIIRTGIVTAVTPSSTAGLYDLSDGAVITNNQNIKAGHYILATRTERGFKTESDTVVLIRGEYSLQ